MTLSLILALVAAAQLPADSALQPVVTIDSARHEVVILTPASLLPSMAGMHDHSMSHDTPVYRFSWPVGGWFNGFRVSVIGPDGQELSRRLMHHLIMINYDRRQLVYPAAERLWGAGIETGNFSLPRTIGVPLDPGTGLGLYIAWHNAGTEDLVGVRLRLAMQWIPRNQNPPPVAVMPLYFDVNLTVGGDNEFDIPPGRSEQSYIFTVPVEGRILGVSGHLHDYGREVRLEDVESGRVLTRVAATLRPDGHLRGMERHLFGIAGEGLRLKADHRYRVVAVYDNPTPDTLVKGAMGSMVGIFAPRRMADWPVISPEDSTYRKDLHFLARRGARSMTTRVARIAPDTTMGHEHHHE